MADNENNEQEIVKYSGTVLGAPIVVGTSLDEFPTHKSEFGKGGWHEVASIAERDAIPEPRLSVGMSVYVLSENKLYVYKGTETDPETEIITKVWEEFKSGGTDIIFRKYIDIQEENK